jgi:hypothetical protein
MAQISDVELQTAGEGRPHVKSGCRSGAVTLAAAFKCAITGRGVSLAVGS